MLDSLEIQMFIRLILAALLGGLVGIERESGDRPAGLRTHILVCTGSALLMLISMYAFDDFSTTRDPGRIAAQVVSGIGFLGAGTILHEGLTVRGLTTAASLWMVAAIGLAIGAGMIEIGIIATLIMLITLIVFHDLEKKVQGSWKLTERWCLHLTIRNDSDAVSEVLAYLTEKRIRVRNVKLENDISTDTVEVELYLKIPKGFNTADFYRDLQSVDGIIKFEDIH